MLVRELGGKGSFNLSGQIVTSLPGLIFTFSNIKSHFSRSKMQCLLEISPEAPAVWV